MQIDLTINEINSDLAIQLANTKGREIHMSSEKKTSITPTPDGPYLVNGLKNFVNQNGPIETKETMALCRCGGSANKPFCDGTHATVGSTDEKSNDRRPDKRDNHIGKEITVHDNRGIFDHAGHCTDSPKSVFLLGKEPFVDPD